MAAESYSPPQPTDLPKASVDRLASSIAEQIGYRPGAELEPIVEKLGGRLVFRPIEAIADPSSGSIKIEREGDFEIVVALHTGAIRDRFTIAHEIGHYVLHYLWLKNQGRPVGPTLALRYGSGRVEWEANWFAAGFLMPAELFRASYSSAGGNLFALADEYRVSHDAARIRAETLRLQQ